MYSPASLGWIQYTSMFNKNNYKPRKGKKSSQKSKLSGRGDYSTEILNESDIMKRIDKKLNHLESQLGRTTISQSTTPVGKLASMAGRALGSVVGQGDLGSAAGSTLAKLFGHGDYTVKTNSLMTSLSGPTIPKFSNEGRAIRVREREYLGDIISSATPGAFSLTSYAVNPTVQGTFPWLSRIAPLFDEWEPHGIVFEFVSTSSEFNGSSQALGAVIMATDYDSFDPLYTSKQQMENADYANSTKPSCNLIHGLECDLRERPTKILYTEILANQPLSFTNLANFQVATQGMSVASVNLGELWISYDISFYKKQINSSTATNIPYFCALGSYAIGQGYFAAPTISGSNVLTVTNNGTGSALNFNNNSTGLLYEVAYYTTNTAGGTGPFYFTVINGTIVTKRDQNSNIGPPTTNLTVWVVQCTSPGTSFVTLNTTVAGSYSLVANQVPAGFAF